MKIVVVGGSGHIGTFLVPRLVRAGHEVITISRGERSSYVDDPAWQQVRQVRADRAAEDCDGTFGARVAALQADAVVDLICFTVDSARSLVEAVRGHTGHLLHCGSIWRHGPSTRHPVTERTGAPPLGEYGVQKAATVELLRQETKAGGLATTTLHPGHIVGPGWSPIGPLGNLDPTVFQTLAAGRPLAVPGIGSEFLHHVHADDVAQAFELAIERRDAAAGEDFDVVAPTALNVRGYAEIVASWFGHRAELRSVGWEELRAVTPAEHYDASWNHLLRNHYVSIDKARTLLSYRPRYQPEEAVLESVRWLIDHEQLEVATPLVV